MSLNDEEQNPLSLHIEQTQLQRQILSQFPCVGTVLRVTAIEAHENFGLYQSNSDNTVLQCIRDFDSRVGTQGCMPSWSTPPYCLTVAICPSQAKDFCIPVGSNQYRMRLTLEDPTARIHALLCGENGIKFFGGFSIDDLAIKMEKLLGIPDNEDRGSLRCPPWINCCINWNSTVYHMCRTMLV
nr:protection of telomeres protein 1a [Quercus suber]